LFPTGSDEVVQVATSEVKACVPQPEIVTPPIVKPTVPVAAVGVKLTPLKVAVNVTDALKLVVPSGVVVVSVPVSFATVWVVVPVAVA